MAMGAETSRLAYWLLKDVNKAIRDFDMIQDGDRIAVAVSGGKDSLSLLDLLDFRLNSSPEKYSLYAIHIVGDAAGPGEAPSPALADWLAKRGLEYAIEPISISDDEHLPMNCQRCTWNRRRTLFEIAQRLGCNKIALGHTADDMAQTTLLNLISNGRVETMAPIRDYFKGELVLIRPLCYLSEVAIRRFSRSSQHPSPPPACSQIDHTRRKQVRNIIRQAESWCPDIQGNLLRAGLEGIKALANPARTPSSYPAENGSYHGDEA